MSLQQGRLCAHASADYIKLFKSWQWHIYATQFYELDIHNPEVF